MTTLADLVDRTGFVPHVPLAIALCDRTSRVETAAWGTWPDGSPVRSTDRFYCASLTKQVTGAAAAVLVREGRLDPDLPVAHYLADLPDWAGRITTRQMIHHTAGLPAAGKVEPAVEDWTQDFALAALRLLPKLTCEPGTAYEYSNLGYILLAEVIARAAGQSFSGFVSTRLFEPLGLDGMHFPQGDVTDLPQAALMGPSLPLTHGDGGLWSTAGTFAAWLHHQNNDTLGIADIVTAPGSLANGDVVDYGWGLGLRRRDGHPLFIHGGEWAGSAAKAVRSPSTGLAVVAMSGGVSMDQLNVLIEAALTEWIQV